MRLHRFHTDTPIENKTFDITDRDLVHQWKSVFRYNVGSQVILFDGKGKDYLCIITSLRNLGATVSVVREMNSENGNGAQRKNVWVCLGLIKKDNFELACAKMTEIGVNHIVPVLCERSEKKKINFERIKKILVESSEQSGRSDVPEIHPIETISEVFTKGFLPQEKIVLDPSGVPFKQYLANTNQASFAVFIGPEGGFSPKELELFKSFNVNTLSLGEQILRAETAAIAVSSLILL